MLPDVSDSGASTPVMSPEAYNAVIEQLAPLDIRLVDLTFTFKSPVHSGPLIAFAEMDLPVKADVTDGPDGAHYVLIEHQARFRIASSDESLAAEGRAHYLVRLRLGFKPPEAFWPIFIRRNIKLYTHPALRDLIASLAARASLVVQPLASVSVTQSILPSLPAPSKALPKQKGTVE